MKYPFVPAIVMACCATLSSAQSDSATTLPKEPGQKQTKHDYVGLNECIGAKVRMNPAAEAPSAAADEEKPAAKPTGKITDIVIATKTGCAEWAVVSFSGLVGSGDKIVVVPGSNLQWNATDKCYDADVSHDHLVSLHSFDAKKARAKGLDHAMTACATSWQKIVAPPMPDKVAEEASAAKAAASKKGADTPVVAIAGTTMVADPARLMYASKIDDYPIYARGEKFGKVSNCVVDRANGTLAFAIASHGGTLGFGKDQYLVPFAALRLAKKGTATVFVVDKSAKDMAACVKYKKPAEGIVDAEAAKRCCATVGATGDQR